MARINAEAIRAARACQAAGGVLTPQMQRAVGKLPAIRKDQTAPCPDCGQAPVPGCERCGGTGLVTAPPANGEGNITQRAQAWRDVEQAQHLLNVAAREYSITETGPERPLTAAFQEAQQAIEDYHRLGAGQWYQVRECQLNVNAWAAKVADLLPLVNVLEARLEEYRRIGGAKDRAPGVGGLS